MRAGDEHVFAAERKQPPGAFVEIRLVVVFHVTFFINSFAHTFGSQDYDPHSTARDSWICAILTNGEGYHNYHHRFPSDYRNGIRWYHWDPTKWLVWSLARIGWARDLNRTPPAQIEAARVETCRLRQTRPAASA